MNTIPKCLTHAVVGGKNAVMSASITSAHGFTSLIAHEVNAIRYEDLSPQVLARARHVLLDWLGTDTAPPLGIMALWPFSHQYYESPWPVFMPISRRYWLAEFWTFNLLALGLELLILMPLATIVLMRRRKSSSGV